MNRADVDAISNVIYVAPNVRYKFSDRWSLDNTVITGWLGTDPIVNRDGGKGLGYEWDLSLNFTPRKGLMWINQAGFLFPGDAWEAGGLYDSKTAYGFVTKAAISF